MSIAKTTYAKLQTVFGVDLLNTLIVTFSLFLASFFSYLLQFYLGRALSIEGFGDFTVLLSVAGIITFFGNVIGYAVVKMYSELATQNSIGKIKWLFSKTIRYAGLIGVFLGILCFLFANSIVEFFNILSVLTVVYFGLYLTLAFVPIYVAVFFQGTYRFIWFSFFIVVSALLRLIVPVVFTQFIAAEVSSVYLAFFISQLLSIFIGYIVASKHVLKVVETEADNFLFHNILKTSLFNGLALFTLTTMISIDVIVVKYLFDPYTAGIYSGVITLGKIILFGAGTVATVMFPRAVSVNKDYIGFKSLFKKFGLIQIVFVFVSLCLFSLFPSLITHTLFGEKFTSSIPYVAGYALFVCLYVLINFVILALIALEEKKFSLYMPVFLFLQLLGFSILHDSLYQIIWVNIISMLLLLVFVALNMLSVFRRLKGQPKLVNNAS